MLRRLNPDIVLGWSTYANLVACATRWPGNLWRLVLSERNYLPQVFHSKRSGLARRWFTLGAIKLLYRCADIITANSKKNRNFMKQYIGANIAYHYLPNIASLPRLDKNIMQPHDIPFNPSGPKILALGRLDPQKGFDIALRAMARVRESRSWSLVVVGDGKERGRLQALSDRLGLSGAVHWIGARIDPLPYYQWSDMVIVPSRFEGFPNVALEAMACGRAVICSDCLTGPMELTDGGKFGILVPPEDPDALAEAIVEVGNDPVGCKSMGETAAQHVADTYGIGVLLPIIENALLNDKKKTEVNRII